MIRVHGLFHCTLGLNFSSWNETMECESNEGVNLYHPTLWRRSSNSWETKVDETLKRMHSNENYGRKNAPTTVHDDENDRSLSFSNQKYFIEQAFKCQTSLQRVGSIVEKDTISTKSKAR